MKSNFWGDNYIGKTTRIGHFCDIGHADIGEHCKIQCHVSIPPGWKIEDNVFIGPGVRFANDKHPKATGDWEICGGLIKKGASIGMGALIGSGVTIGENAVVGMGAVVLKDVPDGETWVGNPAKPI